MTALLTVVGADLATMTPEEKLAALNAARRHYASLFTQYIPFSEPGHPRLQPAPEDTEEALETLEITDGWMRELQKSHWLGGFEDLDIKIIGER